MPGTRAHLTRLHLIRHGHTDALGHTLSGRCPGIGLSALGLREAAATARQMGKLMSGRRPSALLSSPRRRAQQTAAEIGTVLALPVRTEPALDEVEFGEWTAKDFATLDACDGWREWNTLRSLAPTPGGETMLAVQARIVTLVQRLCRDWPDHDVVLVSHSDVLKVLLAYLLGSPIDLMQRMEIAPASHSMVSMTGDTIRIEAVNLVPHLAA